MIKPCMRVQKSFLSKILASSCCMECFSLVQRVRLTTLNAVLSLDVHQISIIVCSEK